MRTRRLGRTGIAVSEMVFGGGAVGGLLIRADDETKLAAVRRAIAAGVNFIDTAPSYGDGKSEEALGWIPPQVTPAPTLATKLRLAPEDMRDIRGAARRELEASLRRLRRDRVDLYQLHNKLMAAQGEPGTIGVEQVLGTGGVADALDDLRSEGLIGHVGLTAVGEAPVLREVIGSDRFDTAQVYYNLLHPSAARPLPEGWPAPDQSGLLEACKAQDVGVLNIRVFAAGVIATDIRHGRERPLAPGTSLSMDERQAQAVFRALGDRWGTRGQTAIRFALANPDIHGVIVGMAEPAHLEEALAGTAMGPLPQDALERLESVYAAGLEA